MRTSGSVLIVLGLLGLSACAVGPSIDEGEAVASQRQSLLNSLTATLTFTTPPAANVRPNNNGGLLDLVAFGTDQHVWRDRQGPTSASWGGFFPLFTTNNGFSPTSAISSVAGQDGRLELFTRGPDNAIWHTRQTAAGSTYDPWSSLGGVSNSAPGVVLRSDGRIAIYAVGWDGRLWQNLQSAANSSTYGGWAEIVPPASANGFTPVVVRSDPIVWAGSNASVNVFFRWADQSLRTVSIASSGATTWTNLGGLVAGNPALSRDGQRVYAIGLDWALWRTAASSSSWTQIGKPAAATQLVTSPIIAENGSSTVDEVFVVGANRRVYSYFSSVGVFSDLGGAVSSNVAAVMQVGTMLVFARGTDGGLWRIEGPDTTASAARNWPAAWTSMGGTLWLPGTDPSAAGVAALTYKYSPARTGANLNETVLTTSNVNAGQFGVLFDLPVDGQIYAQPLYASNVSIGGSVRNVVYVATQRNKVYAFDANTGAQLWMKDFATYATPEFPVPSPNQDFGNAYCPSVNLKPSIGITSTPVIDASTGTMYVEAFSGRVGTSPIPPPTPPTQQTCSAFNTPNASHVYMHRLHALDIATGSEKFSGPFTLTASVTGSGDGGSSISLVAKQHLQRPGLLLSQGSIYLGFGSFADTPPYHGWVLRVPSNFQGLAVGSVFATTPNAGWGGIWQAGHGLAADSSGFVYGMTGNGVNYHEPYYAETFLKLPAALGSSPSAQYREPNFAQLDAADDDLGSSGPILVPNSNFLVGGGKEGYLYTINTSNMALIQKFSAAYEPDNGVNDRNGQVLCARSGAPSHIHGAPVYWSGPQGSWLYVWAERDYIKSFQLDNTGHVATANNSFAPSWCQNAGLCGALASIGTVIGGSGCGMPGGNLSISSNGSVAGTGIVWANHQQLDAVVEPNVAGTLYALDATDLNKELWNSEQAPADKISTYAKSVPPLVANGRVYMATFAGKVRVYGLKVALQ